VAKKSAEHESAEFHDETDKEQRDTRPDEQTGPVLECELEELDQWTTDPYSSSHFSIGVSLKVAVCWEHRPARPRRRSPHVLDWFRRRADDIINRLADYLHATGRATTGSPRARLATMTRSPANWNADAPRRWHA
jgi:hypothetical protein